MNRFLTAVMFLTRVPVGRWVRYAPDELARGTPFFPAVGALVGAAGAGVTVAASFVLSPPLAVIAGMAATVWLTTAFHEDALADAADGFGGGWGREQVLEIMHDSRIGSYAAVALWFGLTAKFVAIAELLAVGPGTATAGLVVGHCVGRATALPLIFWLPYVHRAGHPPRPFAASVTRGRLVAGLAFTLVLTGILLQWNAVPVLLAAAVVAAGVGEYSRRRIGGVTGDVLGTANQLAELAAYVALGVAVRTWG